MRSIEVPHPSFAVWCGVLAAALVVIAGLVVTSHLARLGKCAIAGVIAATALLVYVNAKHHAQLLAAAAMPADGHRLSVTYLLTDAFAFTTLIVTVALFAAVTMAARRRASAFGRRTSPRPARTGWPG